MKSRRQILEWLDKQPWKDEFYEAAFLCDNIICGRVYSEHLIYHAFNWDKTKQGESVWKARDKEYLKWYNSTDKPHSWEEYCRQNPAKEDDWYISGACGILKCNGKRERGTTADINIMSKELCEAFLAYMKLIQLRNAWVKDSDGSTFCYKIRCWDDKIFYEEDDSNRCGLSFPTEQMTKEFTVVFKDLLDVAKPLL